MEKITTPEVWMRGPVEGIPPLLQPVAHALLQAREEVFGMMEDFPEHLLWEKPAGVASPGFHLQHLSGVIDRLFTYASEESLTENQLELLSLESRVQENLSILSLLNRFDEQIERAITQLGKTDESTLTNPRALGRKKIPTTLIGLLFHAAEHTQRHIGQLYVTVKILKG
ncbi:DinB superfamily protein [Pseudarcicella hirudinis]|uniref:DinB superfamily protein n=1 Tax=Pseudarcicella hirudinis TaxID=1079859 RepID=A0A1I5VED1_9BACT|nr:DinB family protein [Pseudarcicella hirudinis]SFQ05835.1 DinB superfamily protein [Pseudarcicella hirudinis]